MPDTLRPHIPASLVFKGLYSATMREDTGFFIWFIGFMVTIEWISRENFIASDWLSGSFSCQYSSRITDISAKDLITHYQNRYTSGSTEIYIDARVVIESTVSDFEGFGKGIFDFIGVNHSLLMLCLVKYPLDLPLNVLSQLRLNKFRNFLSIESMAITNGKEMCPSILCKMWQRQK
jgi:hypothetical protein